MNVSSAREMNDSLAAVTERKPQRPCGCVGIFFQFFDRNRRFAKKLFSKKLLSPARLKQASKKFGGDEKQPKLRLIDDENSGGFSNAKNNGMTNTRCESKREMKAPSLVARLMGLELRPAGSGSKPQKASASETWSNVVDKLGARPGGSDKEDMDLEMDEIMSLEPGLRRFSAQCALTYPTRYFSPLEDEADLAPHHLESPNPCVDSKILKQASIKFGGDEKQPKLRLIADENSGGFPNAKNNGMPNTRRENKREMKAPSLVARLMGLESMPAGSGSSSGCVLEAAFSTDSYLSSSPNNSSKDKVLAESVDSIDDEPLFPEADRDLSDCETLLSTRRSCRELITDHFNNVSGVLSQIDQLKGSKLSYAKQVILNTELIFGRTPQQQALPVEDGFSVSQFLLNEHEIFSSLLWMTFGQLLGYNDPNQMNQLKGFAFDCLLEYLNSKFARYSDSGFRNCTELPSSMTKEISDSSFRICSKLPSSITKEILIVDIIEEVEEWTKFVGLSPNELVEWDISHSLGKCTDFEIEECECGTEVARHILQELVDEVVLDLYSSS